METNPREPKSISPSQAELERRGILVAVDDFTDADVGRLGEAARDWAEVERIPQSSPPEIYRSAIQRAEIVIGWPDPRLLSGGVRLLQLGSSGWDAYEDQGLEALGIAVCSGRGIYSVGVAEHCLAMMFALTRRLTTHFQDQRRRVFRRHPPYGEIAGSTACIVGLGSIGTALSIRCKGVGMRVTAVVRNPPTQSSSVDALFSLEELRNAVHQADHVFMTASGGRANERLFTREILEAFRPTAYFYNVSRGATVDETALCELLAQGRIAGAGLDVAQQEPPPRDSPLWKLGQTVLITGHSAGISQHYPQRFCELAIRNLHRYRRGEPLENRVI